MRVTFARSATGVGFFPGLAEPITIEEDRLPEAQARELDALVASTAFFDRPAAPATRGADRRQYTITIEQGGRSRTLVVDEPIDDPELRRLIALLEAAAKEARAQPPVRGAP